MCGISGVIDRRFSSNELSRRIQRSLDLMEHRGPNDVGLQIEDNHLIMAHRRLSIQDISPSGHQPMTSANERFVIVFNGEIYNFKGIATTLVNDGIIFRGHSDTEVLLEAIAHWGLSTTLEQLVGMYAFALYDRKDKTLSLVRDPIGEKPLYYSHRSGALSWASELSALKPLLGDQPEINLNALGNFFKYGYISAPESILQGVRKVEPGHTLRFDLKNLSLIEDQPFWSLPKTEPDHQRYPNFETAQSTFEDLLNQSIEEKLIADVPVGSFLSGGIDSTLVTALAQKQKDQQLDTFTIGFHEKQFNEAEHAKAIAKHLGTRHHEIMLSADDFLTYVEKNGTIFDEPFSNASSLALHSLCELARKNVTVCLAGDGGDELFSGYNRYHLGASMYDYFSRVPEQIRKLAGELARLVPNHRVDRIVQWCNSLLGRKGGANIGLKYQKLTDLLQLDSADDIYNYLCSYWFEPKALLTQHSQMHPNFNEFNKGSFIRNAMFWDQKAYLPGEILYKSDRVSMASSLEVRVPLLDKRLVEFSATLPDEYLGSRENTKKLLRTTLYQHVPKTLIERPKMGFTVPVGEWLRGPLREWAYTSLSSTSLTKHPYLNAKLIQQTLDEHCKLKRDNSNELWSLLTFINWYQNQ